MSNMIAMKMLIGGASAYIAAKALPYGIWADYIGRETQDGEVFTVNVFLFIILFALIPTAVGGGIAAVFNYLVRTTQHVWVIGAGTGLIYGGFGVFQHIDVEEIRGQLVMAFILYPVSAIISAVLTNAALNCIFGAAPGLRLSKSNQSE